MYQNKSENNSILGLNNEQYKQFNVLRLKPRPHLYPTRKVNMTLVASWLWIRVPPITQLIGSMVDNDLKNTFDLPATIANGSSVPVEEREPSYPMV